MSPAGAAPQHVSCRVRRIGVVVAALCLLLAATLARAALLGHGGPVKGIAVSADGQRAVTAGFDYSLMLWDLARQQPLERLTGHDAAVNAVALFPEGGRAVSASDDGTLGLWDLASARLLARWPGHRGKAVAVAVSPDGATVASGGWDRTLRLWDAATGASRLVAAHDANVNAVAFSPDGRIVASGDYDGLILLHRVADGGLVARLAGHSLGVNALAFAPDGRLVSASSDDTVRVWDLATRSETLRYAGHDHPVLALALSGDGTLVASGAADGAVDLWRLDGAQHLRTIYAHRGPVWALAFAPGGDRLLSSGSDGVVRLWDLTTGAEANGAVPPVAAAPEPQERGARLFRKCGMCHALTAEDGGKAGPTLHHLFGRRAGSVPGYPYSPALRDSGIVWTAEAVDRLFAEGPEVVAPGSKMPLQRMPDPRDRADLIEFLQRAGGD